MSDGESYEGRIYDVVIMGGGPAGATLAALLARHTKLKVALFEKDFFPREHIGESFSHRVIPVLEESGVLGKVLATDIWVKKFGGFYAWDPHGPPATTFFDPDAAKKDGVLRWAFHCNRSEFDEILLRHAREIGVHVFEGVGVTSVTRDGDTSRVELGDAGETRCRIFVEASGRQTTITTGTRKNYLSQYKNIAIWNHVVGGKPAQSLAGDWNIFRDKNISPIGNFAFEDGWFWYIPVPKVVMGKRTRTHSLGMVTDPGVLRDPSKRYTDMRYFMEQARKVPLLRELLVEAEPIADKVLTATNYSMISETFCDYDNRWILIGDAAYFIDPLFSSGVAFALSHAASAALVIKSTFDEGLSEALKREVWLDYDEGWHALARSFTLAIDQWYHAIAANNPSSVYWHGRAQAPLLDLKTLPFQALVDTGVSPDLLRVITRGSTDVAALGKEGPLVEALARAKEQQAPQDAKIAIRAGVAVKESMTIEVGRSKGMQLPGPDAPADPAAARYWADPIQNADAVPPIHPGAKRCGRFYFADRPDAPQVRFDPVVHGGWEIFERLRQPSVHSEIRHSLSAGQQALLSRLFVAGMIDVAG